MSAPLLLIANQSDAGLQWRQANLHFIAIIRTLSLFLVIISLSAENPYLQNHKMQMVRYFWQLSSWSLDKIPFWKAKTRVCSFGQILVDKNVEFLSMNCSSASLGRLEVSFFPNELITHKSYLRRHRGTNFEVITADWSVCSIFQE